MLRAESGTRSLEFRSALEGYSWIEKRSENIYLSHILSKRSNLEEFSREKRKLDEAISIDG